MTQQDNAYWASKRPEFLSAYKATLEEAEEIQRRIMDAARDVIEDHPVKGDYADHGDATFQRTMAIAMRDGAEQARDRLAARLHDVAEHPETVGFCSDCGDPIYERLLIEPGTTRCAACKNCKRQGTRSNRPPQRENPPGTA